MIITGSPMSAPYTDPANTIEYVRDLDDVLGDPVTAAAFDGNARLPATASDTGFRNGDRELWIDDASSDFVYVVRGDSVERWPRDGETPICA